MTHFVDPIVTIALMVVGLAVLIGRLKAEDALTRIAIFVLVIAIMPSITVLISRAIPAAAKIAIALALLALVVTGFVRLMSRVN